ncbi:MAG: small basic protein [Gemmataceae bacterium]|nr:small basic protein [Gemmataceae bacterium]
MSIDKSLKRKGGMGRTRCVLTRAERIAKMTENGAFAADRSPFGLPKTRVQKVVLKKKAKKEAAEGDAAAAAMPSDTSTALEHGKMADEPAPPSTQPTASSP